MKTLKIHVLPTDPSRRIRKNRYQLLGAALGILLGFWETLDLYRGIALALPIIGFGLAVFNIFIAKKYTYWENRFGPAFDRSLFRLNGLVMLITGLGFYVGGSGWVKYIYFTLAFHFIVIAPHVRMPWKRKRFLRFGADGIVVSRTFRKPSVHPWHDVEAISLYPDHLDLKLRDEKRAIRFSCQLPAEEAARFLQHIRRAREEHDFFFDSRR